MKTTLLPIVVSIGLSISVILSALIMAGCAEKEMKFAQAAPAETTQAKVNKPLAFAEQRIGDTVIYQGRVANPRKVPQTALQNAAVEFKLAARHFKTLGIRYFTLSPRQGVPFMITNFEDLAAYCYPDSEGFGVEGIHAKKTNLARGKCSIEDKSEAGGGGAHIWFIGKAKISASPVWSVAQVLNDKSIDRYIETAMDAADIPAGYRTISVTHQQGNIIPR